MNTNDRVIKLEQIMKEVASKLLNIANDVAKTASYQDDELVTNLKEQATKLITSLQQEKEIRKQI